MDIVFAHSVGLHAKNDGVVERRRFGCQEKVANVTCVPDIFETNRSHYDILLKDGTTLLSVPATAFRVESSTPTSTKTSTTKATSRSSK